MLHIRPYKLILRNSQFLSCTPVGSIVGGTSLKWATLWGRHVATAGSVEHSNDNRAGEKTTHGEKVWIREDKPPNVVYSFKSAAHRDMVVQLTRQDLLSRLLIRFGDFRQKECEILHRNHTFRKILLLWAEILVRENPAEPAADAFFVPPDLYSIPEFQSLLNVDTQARWLMRRIDPGGNGGRCEASGDCVPVPHFPSVLLQHLPVYPLEPYQMEFIRDTYGLFKWPFKPVKPSTRRAAVKSSAMATAGSEENPSVAKAGPTPASVTAAVAAIATAVDEGDVQIARCPSVTANPCTTATIYAPDEMETGAYTHR